jgi:hypothetical protein
MPAPSPLTLAACAGFSPQLPAHDLSFAEFRRKVRDSELLSASLERLLAQVRFSGRLSIVVQNGRVLKSGYEEGYFARKSDERLLP